ncbi:Leucine rich repeat protein bspa family [Entamoeba marina]
MELLDYNHKQLDSYSILICSKYFISSQDYINIICLRFNPISITSLQLFPKIQTQHLYNNTDKKINGIERYEHWFEVSYGDYLKLQDQQNKYNLVSFGKLDTERYGVTIPNGVNVLDNSCFSYSNIQLINIPSRVIKIGNGCFEGSSSLQSITLPSVSQCSSLTQVILPLNLVVIKDECFLQCKLLQTITIPTSLILIGDKCFSECGIKSIEIPTTIKSIGTDCFLECASLTNITLQSKTKEFYFKVTYSDLILYKQFGIKCNNIILSKKRC